MVMRTMIHFLRGEGPPLRIERKQQEATVQKRKGQHISTGPSSWVDRGRRGLKRTAMKRNERSTTGKKLLQMLAQRHLGGPSPDPRPLI